MLNTLQQELNRSQEIIVQLKDLLKDAHENLYGLCKETGLVDLPCVVNTYELREKLFSNMADYSREEWALFCKTIADLYDDKESIWDMGEDHFTELLLWQSLFTVLNSDEELINDDKLKLIEKHFPLFSGLYYKTTREEVLLKLDVCHRLSVDILYAK